MRLSLLHSCSLDSFPLTYHFLLSLSLTDSLSYSCSLALSLALQRKLDRGKEEEDNQSYSCGLTEASVWSRRSWLHWKRRALKKEEEIKVIL